MGGRRALGRPAIRPQLIGSDHRGAEGRADFQPACAAVAHAFDRLLNASVGDMKYDKYRNAKLIIPLALMAWIGGIVLTREGVPVAIAAIFVSAFAIAVPGAVSYTHLTLPTTPYV